MNLGQADCAGLGRYTMHSNVFNPLIGTVFEQWVSDCTGIPMSADPIGGPDLINERCFVEVKFRQIPYSWAMLGKALQYHIRYPHLQGLVVLGKYSFSKSVKDTRTKSLKRLEGMVTRREAYIHPWSDVISAEQTEGVHDTYIRLRLAATYSKVSIDDGKGILYLHPDVDTSLLPLL